MADNQRSSAPDQYATSTPTVIGLTFFLIVLIILLVFLYKKLNWDTDGEYTIQRIIFKEGGVRDQVRGAVRGVETRLGVQLWPGSDFDEDGEEMQEVCIEDRQVEDGSSQGSDDEGDDQGEESEEEERRRDKSDTSDNDSSSEGSEAGDNVRLVVKEDEEETKVGDHDCIGEASGGAGLLIDIKQLSGSATWSEDGVCRDSDVTAL